MAWVSGDGPTCRVMLSIVLHLLYNLIASVLLPVRLWHFIKKVTIEERLDGTMHILVNKRGLEYKEITSRPVREIEKHQNILTKTTRLSSDHPGL